METALITQLAAAGAVKASYQGASTLAHFGDVAAEFATLCGGCALTSLDWRAKLIVTGADRVRWLNGVVSNNVRDLPFEQGNHSFVLDDKGHILGDVDVFQCGEYLLVATSAAQMPRLKAHFEDYIVMDDVELTEVSEQLASIGVKGSGARHLLDNFGLPFLDPGQICKGVLDEVGFSVTRETEPAADGYEFWVSAANAQHLCESIASLGAKPVGSEAHEWLRIARGTPLCGLDLKDTDLPQESGQMHLLHFAKGCYIGQETVERVRSRGNVRRVLCGLEIAGSAPEPGSPVLHEGKEVGITGSAARVVFAAGARTLALAMLRREASAPGLPVNIQGVAATVASLPFEY
jgi:aminomethyltransferase